MEKYKILEFDESPEIQKTLEHAIDKATKLGKGYGKYLTDIIEKIITNGLKNEIMDRFRYMDEINPDNLPYMIELIHYTYVLKNYGRLMGETIFDIFVNNNDKKFQKDKLNTAKRQLDTIYNEYINSTFKIKSKTEELLQKFFK